MHQPGSWLQRCSWQAPSTPAEAEGSSSHRPPEQEKEPYQEVAWKAIEQPEDIDPFEWQINNATQAESRASTASASASGRKHGREQDLHDDDSDNEEEDDLMGGDDHEEEEEEEETQQDEQELEINIINSVSERTRVVEEALPDKYGRRVIYVPLTAGSVDNIRKAIIYLWKHQSARTASHPNPASNPRRDVPLREAFDNYEVALVSDQATSGTTRTGTCAIRDPYTEKLFIRMLSYLWRMLPLPQKKNKRQYNSTKRFQYMRERLCLLARHHMLLRDEDIRNINLWDLFNIQTMHPATRSKLASGLVFCLSRGKTNKKGVKLYATVYRHKNFLRCTVAAFAFYMLERFEAGSIATLAHFRIQEWSACLLFE